MVHDLSPIVFQIYDGLAIRWYGLSYILGFVSAYFLLLWLVQRQKQGITPAMVGDLVTYGALGTLIGGRVGYCLFYSPDLFLKFKSAFPYWGVFAVNEGGMASHGGMLGLVIACWLYSVRHGVKLLYLYDLGAVSAPIGIFFGRIANYINGELLGRPCPPDFPLAVKFPTEIYLWPTQSFDRLGSLTPVIDKIPDMNSARFLENVDKYKMDASARDAVYGALSHIVDAIQSGNAAAKEAIAPLLEPRHPSQLYGALGEGLLLFLILFIFWRKPRKPGMIACCFGLFYAIARISDEQFRMPDVQIGYQLFGLTRGQWLSIALMAISLAFMFLWGRRETLRIPGWSKGQNVRIHRR